MEITLGQVDEYTIKGTVYLDNRGICFHIYKGEDFICPLSVSFPKKHVRAGEFWVNPKLPFPKELFMGKFFEDALHRDEVQGIRVEAWRMLPDTVKALDELDYEGKPTIIEGATSARFVPKDQQ